MGRPVLKNGGGGGGVFSQNRTTNYQVVTTYQTTAAHPTAVRYTDICHPHHAGPHPLYVTRKFITVLITARSRISSRFK